MMKKGFYLAVGLFCCTVILAPTRAGELVYVSSREAKIHREAKLGSAIVGVLKKSEAVEIVEQKKVWMQVRKIDISGWISRYSVSSARPAEEKLSIFSRLKNFFDQDNRRVRLTFVSTAGGVRDLTEEESDAAGKTDFKALRVLESIEISDAEIDAFISGNAP